MQKGWGFRSEFISFATGPAILSAQAGECKVLAASFNYHSNVLNDVLIRQPMPRPFFLSIAALAAAMLCSCNFQTPTVSRQPPAITREMLAAARTATSGRAQAVARPERATKQSEGAERILITLPADPSGQPDASLVPKLEFQLDRIASAHRFRRIPRNSTQGLIRFDYERSAQPTQMVEIIVPTTAPLPITPARAAGSPRLAVIVDDLGSDRAPAESLLALSVPITFAVLPNLENSKVIAEEAGRRGIEVMLHLPIAPKRGYNAGKGELRPGMKPNEVDRTLAEMLLSVPNATGVNHHEGSRGTADPTLMAELMPCSRAAISSSWTAAPLPPPSLTTPRFVLDYPRRRATSFSTTPKIPQPSAPSWNLPYKTPAATAAPSPSAIRILPR